MAESVPTFRRNSVSVSHAQRQESEPLLGVETDDYNMEGLHSKKREGSISNFNRLKSKDQTMECDIHASDTLLSLAFKYKVQVAEIKRVNNILGDAEFFALKKIKIPVRPSSLLTEVLPGDPPELGDFENNNGWKVENKESPNKSLVSINVYSEYSSPVGSEADMERPLSPQTLEGNKQKKRVKEMLEGVDEDLDAIKIKQAELENAIKETETMEQQVMSSSRSSGVGSNKTRSSFKLACVCSFLLVASLLLMGGLVTMVSIEHSGVEEGEW
eukprot:GFUD01122328.1.p1 GENE.GFUD01122328.1~~GFUD01122328.1.p1  ORF type:complete len:289 (-),score=82.45 GFUD01122328.1:253-1068(-)